MDTVCILLNYNDAETLIRHLKAIASFRCFDTVIVVDNASTDDSVLRIEEYINNTTAVRTVLLKAETNRGYGAGNNMGIEYARRVLRARYALVANPDTQYTSHCIRTLRKFMQLNPQVGVCAPVQIHVKDGKIISPGSRKAILYGAPASPLRSWIYDLIESGPICRRLFYKALYYPESYYREKKCVSAGKLPGSLLFLDLKKADNCGGFDERVFLYAEENILAYRMNACEYRTALILTETYNHLDNTTIGKTYADLRVRQKIRLRSTMLYYTSYLKIGIIKRIITRLFFAAENLEILIAAKLGICK